MVLLRLFDYQGALTVRYHRLRSFYRRRLFAAYFQILQIFFIGSENNKLESGGIRVNMLTRRFAFAPPCGAAAPFVRDIESGRGDIKDKKRQSSYAVKSSVHAIGVKNILIFPIHEVKHF